jgi:hypothetical protein
MLSIDKDFDQSASLVRRRKSIDLEPVKSRDIVLFSPKTGPPVAEQRGIWCRKEPLAIEGNRELVLLCLNLEHMPMIECGRQHPFPRPFLLAIHYSKQIDSLFQRARFY